MNYSAANKRGLPSNVDFIGHNIFPIFDILPWNSIIEGGSGYHLGLGFRLSFVSKFGIR
jgi:hypothetical protein